MSGVFALLLVLLVLLGLFAVVAAVTGLLEGSRLERLRAFAAQLEGGRLVGEARAIGVNDIRVEGRRRGHPLVLRFEAAPLGRGRGNPGGPDRAFLELCAPTAAGSFAIVEQRWAERLEERLGIANHRWGTHTELSPGVLVSGGDPAAVRGLLQAPAVREAIERVLAVRGVNGISLEAGTLTVRFPALALGADDLLALTDGLADLAKGLERRLVQVAPREGQRRERFAWTGGGGPRCPFCKDDLAEDAPDANGCAACGTLHHAECLAEGGGCAVFGCGGGRAPVRS